MIYIDLPTISQGTTEQQLAEIRSYIYKSNEQMNATLANLTVDKIWEQTASALSASDNSKGETDKLVSQYQKIRDLIIKTADTIIQTDEQMKMTMNGSYLAKSQFGKYLLNTSVELEGKSTGFTQLYTYASELGSDYDNYKIYQQNFIKQGLLDDSDGIPVYGIDVGLLTSEFEVDGEKVKVNSNKKLRITPDKLSLYENKYEVAYIEKEQIYFPSAVISGGSININNKFTVSSEGIINAKEGNFSGTLATNSLMASWNKWSNGGIKLENSQINTYYLGEQIFSISPNRIAFYKLYSDGSSLEMANLQRLQYGNHAGLGIKLEYPLGSFFTIAKESDDSLGYAPLITYSRGNVAYIAGNNIKQYGEGLNIETPCYFHNSEVRGMNIKQISSDGYATRSVRTWIKCVDENGNEYTSEIKVRNGLITLLDGDEL